MFTEVQSLLIQRIFTQCLFNLITQMSLKHINFLSFPPPTPFMQKKQPFFYFFDNQKISLSFAFLSFFFNKKKNM